MKFPDHRSIDRRKCVTILVHHAVRVLRIDFMHFRTIEFLEKREDAAGDAPPLVRPCFFPQLGIVVVVPCEPRQQQQKWRSTGRRTVFCNRKSSHISSILLAGQQGIRDGAHQSQSARTGQCGGAV